MTSLGNVEATPLASLTFVSFKTGDILYLTGNARNLYGAEARTIMPFQDTLTEIFVTGYSFIRNAFPVREDNGFEIQASPYSPPVKLLAEEDERSTIFAMEQQPKALLTRVTFHNPTIATFEWESSTPIQSIPGQAIILDFSALLGSRRYQHMSPKRPSLVNDDFIRTWTISSAAANTADTNAFSLTMREKPDGIVTAALFTLLRKLSATGPEALDNTRALALSVNIVGISGDFVLPSPPKALGAPINTTQRHLLWIAGGIGITPFISMLSAISQSDPTGTSPLLQIYFVISTREPDVVVSLISTALGNENAQVPSYIKIHIFSNALEVLPHSVLKYTRHCGRIPLTFFHERKEMVPGTGTKGIYLCGSGPFESTIMDALGIAHVRPEDIHREGFVY
jgi:NAD(P)H-flavin reductase